jgi:DHA2 family multidrug resistance protein-like MFS transporter
MFHDPKQRTSAIGLWGTSFALGGAIGPLVGGAFLEHFWWGSVFLLAVPVMVLLLTVGPKLLPEFRDPDAGRLDLVSAALSLVAVISAIYGLKQIAQDGFGTTATASIMFGLVLGYVFTRRQSRLDDPLIDLKLFKVPAFSVSVATNALGGFVAFGTFLYIAQYLQLVLGLSPWEAGLWTLPSSAAVVISSMLAPSIVQRVRPAYAGAAGMTLTALGLIILNQIGPGSGVSVAVLGSIVFSLGLGPVFIVATDLIIGTAPAERAGSASAISETGAEFGGAFGIAILGSIGTAIYRSELADAVPAGVPPEVADAARDTLGGALAAAGELPGQLGGAFVEGARDAFIQGLHVATTVGAAVALAIAILVLATLRHVRAGGASEGAEEERTASVLEPVCAES